MSFHHSATHLGIFNVLSSYSPSNRSRGAVNKVHPQYNKKWPEHLSKPQAEELVAWQSLFNTSFQVLAHKKSESDKNSPKRSLFLSDSLSDFAQVWVSNCLDIPYTQAFV